MNGYQRVVLLATIALIAIMLLFPPWYSEGKGSFAHVRIARGYRYLNAPPPGGANIDFARYLAPVGVVCFIALLAYLELQSPKKKRNAESDCGA